jgi:hypothetical protein
MHSAERLRSDTVPLDHDSLYRLAQKCIYGQRGRNVGLRSGPADRCSLGGYAHGYIIVGNNVKPLRPGHFAATGQLRYSEFVSRVDTRALGLDEWLGYVGERGDRFWPFLRIIRL